MRHLWLVFVLLLERISDSEMQTLTVFERGEVVETALVGKMETYTPIQTKHEKFKVVAYANTCAEGSLFEQILQLKFGVGPVSVIVHRPNVSCIEEQGTVEITKQTWTVFQIE